MPASDAAEISPSGTARARSSRQVICRVATILLMLGFFLCVWGAKLWVIDRFGSDLPYWDQWDAEARMLYIPYFENRLGVGAFFEPHNEHRVVFTKLLNFGLLIVNGMWDGTLQCVVNAAIYGLLGLATWRAIDAHTPRGYRLPVLLVGLGVFAPPIAHHNTIAGFHSQQYFLLWTSLLAMYALLKERSYTTRWWTGAAACVGALFSMGSGLLAGAAIASVIVLLAITRRENVRPQLPTLAVCAVTITAGLLMHVEFGPHLVMRARTVGEFIVSCAHCFQWPYLVSPYLGLLIQAPLLAYSFWFVFRCKQPSAWEKVLFAAGIWYVLQVAASGYARGAGAYPPPSRYLDTLVFGLLVNAAMLLLGVIRLRAHANLAPVATYLTSLAWIAAVSTGVYLHVAGVLRKALPDDRAQFASWESTVAGYLATDRRALLFRNPIPYPRPDAFSEWLRVQRLREVMPPSVRRPLSLQPDPSQSGYVLGGVPPGLPPLNPGIPMFGSYNATAGAAAQTWRSSLVTTDHDYIQVAVAGTPSAAAARLEASSWSDAPLASITPHSAESWKRAYVRVPDGKFRLEAKTSSEGWLGFSAPVEIARLSVWARALSKGGRQIFWVGSLLVIVAASVRTGLCRSPTSPDASTGL